MRRRAVLVVEYARENGRPLDLDIWNDYLGTSLPGYVQWVKVDEVVEDEAV
jgi:hypothetical protein